MRKLKLFALLLALMFCLAATAEAPADEFISDVPADEYIGEFGDIYDDTLDSVPPDERISVNDYAPAEGLSDEWWNILLLGTDSYKLETRFTRTDSMIILSINMATKQAKLTSIMRDTWVHIDGRRSNCKLNAACVYGGPELTMRTINQSFGMNLEDYVLINLPGLANVIDMIGGLDMDVTEAERRALNKGLFDLSDYSGMEQLEQSGENVHVNGNQAVAFARIRKIDTDYKRTERQRTVLLTMARKLKSANDPFTLVGVVTSLLPMVTTNLTLPEMMQLASVGLEMDFDTVEQLRIPAEGTSIDGMYNGTWCIRPNFEKNRAILRKFIYGE